MIPILISDEFASELDRYAQALKDQVLHKVGLLQTDPAHPSLKVHRIKQTDDKWECYVNTGYRIIYDRSDGQLRLWKLGPHLIIDRVRHAAFAAHTAFHRPVWDEEPEAEVAVLAAVPHEVVRPLRGPFSDFPITHLRLLGVPHDLVRTVRSAPDMEAIEQIPGLPPQTAGWLMEILTSPELDEVIYNPGRLLFRTTLDRLEGYCQGSIRQLMLNLTPDQVQYVEQSRPGITVLKGVAGSGKTTVGIYRAIRRAGEGRRVIMLTFNRTLNTVTRSLIESLIGPLPENLEVINIDRWIAEFLRECGIASAPLDDLDTLAHIEAALAEARESGREAVLQQIPAFFRDEIARVIKHLGLTTLEQYLTAERRGRGLPLGPDQRRALWRVYAGYQRRLAEAGRHDWRDPALLAYEALLKQPLADPYHDVIIDEGQDLSPVQLRIAQRLIRGGDPTVARSLLLLGDAAQTIYTRGFAWRQAGIAAQGRTFSLKKNHRNTRQVAEAAARLLSHNQNLKAGSDWVSPEWTERAGPWPIVIECDVADRELRAVRERLLDLVSDQRFRVSDFAVICPTIALCERVRDHLLAAGLPCAMHRDEEFEILEEQVKVLTIHSAKGLEFPVVFLIGLREGILPNRPSMRIDSDERELELERQRTLLYVGMTRAAEALYLVTTAGARSGFLGELGETVRTESFSGVGG